ncbi:hypothetical protein GSH19_04885 [Lactobacillus sp. S2-2]|uniref:WxL domain-containing protein n=1 Tax=Lactobacillus sp. S2-2 TaxID=2692917 RepID=UPI001F424AFC|nr:WxL domain-containing protein [Lactobacillus sp. S2-2]MCF6515486.1 hypothetical protein [Lactobacillus sp. S2-2]
MRLISKIFFCFLFASSYSVCEGELISASDSAVTYGHIGFKDITPNNLVNPVNPNIPNYDDTFKDFYSSLSKGHQYIQVTDKRTNANGWAVSAKLHNGFIDSAEGKQALTGASINIPSGTATNSRYNSETQGSNNLTSNKNLELSKDSGSQTVMQTSNDNNGVGKGTSTDYWDAKDVYLRIPRDTAKSGKTYTTTIDWSLTAGA